MQNSCSFEIFLDALLIYNPIFLLIYCLKFFKKAVIVKAGMAIPQNAHSSSKKRVSKCKPFKRTLLCLILSLALLFCSTPALAADMPGPNPNYEEMTLETFLERYPDYAGREDPRFPSGMTPAAIDNPGYVTSNYSGPLPGKAIMTRKSGTFIPEPAPTGSKSPPAAGTMKSKTAMTTGTTFMPSAPPNTTEPPQTAKLPSAGRSWENTGTISTNTVRWRPIGCPSAAFTIILPLLLPVRTPFPVIRREPC